MSKESSPVAVLMRQGQKPEGLSDEEILNLAQRILGAHPMQRFLAEIEEKRISRDDAMRVAKIIADFLYSRGNSMNNYLG